MKQSYNSEDWDLSSFRLSKIIKQLSFVRKAVKGVRMRHEKMRDRLNLFLNCDFVE